MTFSQYVGLGLIGLVFGIILVVQTYIMGWRATVVIWAVSLALTALLVLGAHLLCNPL